MRFKSKPKPPTPKLGDKKLEYVFCLLPFKCDDGYTIWLGHRKEIYEYRKHSVRLPRIRGMQAIELPVIEVTGWALEQTLSRVSMSQVSEICCQNMPMP